MRWVPPPLLRKTKKLKPSSVCGKCNPLSAYHVKGRGKLGTLFWWKQAFRLDLAGLSLCFREGGSLTEVLVADRFCRVPFIKQWGFVGRFTTYIKGESGGPAPESFVEIWVVGDKGVVIIYVILLYHQKYQGAFQCCVHLLDRRIPLSA